MVSARPRARPGHRVDPLRRRVRPDPPRIWANPAERFGDARVFHPQRGAGRVLDPAPAPPPGRSRREIVRSWHPGGSATFDSRLSASSRRFRGVREREGGVAGPILRRLDPALRTAMPAFFTTSAVSVSRATPLTSALPLPPHLWLDLDSRGRRRVDLRLTQAVALPRNLRRKLLLLLLRITPRRTPTEAAERMKPLRWITHQDEMCVQTI